MTDTTHAAELFVSLGPEPDPMRRAVTEFLERVDDIQARLEEKLAAAPDDERRFVYAWGLGAYQGAVLILRAETHRG